MDEEKAVDTWQLGGIAIPLSNEVSTSKKFSGWQPKLLENKS